MIGEIKLKSPSAGVLRKSFKLEQLAKIYQKNGVSAISVLTDKKFFNGSISNLSRVKRAVSIPVLAKDFFIDPYQIYEARAAGADAVLLIVRILSDKKLSELFALGKKLGMDSLVEVHSRGELERALNLGADIVGVNNRDLDTFHVDIGVSLALVRFIPEKVCAVAESGISTKKDALMLKKAGYDGILAGEALMRSKNPGRSIKQLLPQKDVKRLFQT